MRGRRTSILLGVEAVLLFSICTSIAAANTSDTGSPAGSVEVSIRVLAPTAHPTDHPTRHATDHQTDHQTDDRTDHSGDDPQSSESHTLPFTGADVRNLALAAVAILVGVPLIVLGRRKRARRGRASS